MRNKPGANEIIFSVILWVYPGIWDSGSRLKLSCTVQHRSLERFYLLPHSQTSHRVRNICVCLNDNRYKIYYLAFHGIIRFSGRERTRCFCSNCLLRWWLFHVSINIGVSAAKIQIPVLVVIASLRGCHLSGWEFFSAGFQFGWSGAAERNQFLIRHGWLFS